MNNQDQYELKQRHLGWLHNPNVSRGQLEDSKTILNLLDENAKLRKALKYIRDTEWSSEQVNPLKYVARQALSGREWKE